jgi:hypothetical protein
MNKQTTHYCALRQSKVYAGSAVADNATLRGSLVNSEHTPLLDTLQQHTCPVAKQQTLQDQYSTLHHG